VRRARLAAFLGLVGLAVVLVLADVVELLDSWLFVLLLAILGGRIGLVLARELHRPDRLLRPVVEMPAPAFLAAATDDSEFRALAPAERLVLLTSELDRLQHIHRPSRHHPRVAFRLSVFGTAAWLLVGVAALVTGADFLTVARFVGLAGLFGCVAAVVQHAEGSQREAIEILQARIEEAERLAQPAGPPRLSNREGPQPDRAASENRSTPDLLREPAQQ
jgi:hypothetical protein